MKKKINCLWFLLLISLFLVNNVAVVDAQENGKTAGEIGFVDGKKETPGYPKVPREPENPKQHQKESNGLLPKTGEELLKYLTIIGLISLAVTALVFVIKKWNKQGCS